MKQGIFLLEHAAGLIKDATLLAWSTVGYVFLQKPWPRLVEQRFHQHRASATVNLDSMIALCAVTVKTAGMSHMAHSISLSVHFRSSDKHLKNAQKNDYGDCY